MLQLPLLVLLMAVQVTFACQCGQINWERVMCPGENKTVLMGSPMSEHRARLGSDSEAVTVKHKLLLERLFKEGPNNVTVTENTVMMFTPGNCSPAFSNSTTMYLIYGDTDVGGVLQSSVCSMEDTSEFFKRSGENNIENIVWGRQAPQC